MRIKLKNQLTTYFIDKIQNLICCDKLFGAIYLFYYLTQDMMYV